MYAQDLRKYPDLHEGLSLEDIAVRNLRKFYEPDDIHTPHYHFDDMYAYLCELYKDKMPVTKHAFWSALQAAGYSRKERRIKVTYWELSEEDIKESSNV